MSDEFLSMPELNRRAFAILSKELGVPETLRFFGQFGGIGNYTEERRELFAGLTLDDYRQDLQQISADHQGDDDKN